jgi:hypothetical protein
MTAFGSIIHLSQIYKVIKAQMVCTALKECRLILRSKSLCVTLCRICEKWSRIERNLDLSLVSIITTALDITLSLSQIYKVIKAQMVCTALKECRLILRSKSLCVTLCRIFEKWSRIERSLDLSFVSIITTALDITVSICRLLHLHIELMYHNILLYYIRLLALKRA